MERIIGPILLALLLIFWIALSIAYGTLWGPILFVFCEVLGLHSFQIC
jgi:hypothetical protein